MLVPTGWLSQRFVDKFLAGEMQNAFLSHLLQEFGTVVAALGLVFLWRASQKEWSPTYHWAMTLYFSFDSLIHWIGPDGVIGSWSRGITNTIPLALMVVMGVLQVRAGKRQEVLRAA
jgi:hypothetical protein